VQDAGSCREVKRSTSTRHDSMERSGTFGERLMLHSKKVKSKSSMNRECWRDLCVQA